MYEKNENPLTSKINLIVGVWNGTVIDLETTGLSETNDEIITLGFIEKNQLQIIQRTAHDKEEFYREIRGVIKGLQTPFYAYNNFEEKFIKGQLGLKKKVVDVFKPWKEKADADGIKWSSLDDLVSEPEIYFGLPRVTGRDCPACWNKYLSTGDKKHLKLIMEHNKSDILRTLPTYSISAHLQ
jgi:uncharacterized protein YprB with RNaseH-like and TPR domain